MKTIHILPPSIVAKIAAGEVIERPAYAVKELIENAIDAHASHITVEIEETGLKKIIVTDNGKGMTTEDLLLSFKPHTTSKISEEEHLIGIKSLGFRGEALSSIAAISDLIIQSRSEDSALGNIITVHAGEVVNMSPIGMPMGTRVSIERLFSNMPVRKKFLKSTRTEFRHILEIIIRYAIAFPTIRFFLMHNKRIILDFPQNQTTIERVKTILGYRTFENLIPVSYEYSSITLSGFISRPPLSTRSTDKSFLYVNNRSVTDKTIMSLVREAYRTLLEPASYPVSILFLSIPFERVDVNVHPRKEQVHFIEHDILASHIHKAISQSLAAFNVPFRTSGLTLGDNTKVGSTNSFSGKTLKEVVLPWQIKTEILNKNEITQVHNRYLLMQTKNGLLLIDQHAAHERILYEQFLLAFRKEQKERKELFTLNKPLQVELSVSDAHILQENLSLFFSLGFMLEHFRDTSFILRSVPILFQDRDFFSLITELLDTLRDEKVITIDKQTQKMIAYLACRKAIKAGDAVTKKEAINLINELNKTVNNATCPHGRPTKIEIGIQDIDALFKRR